MTLTGLLAAVAVAVGVLLAVPDPGLASSGLKTILQDDQLLIYSNPQTEVKTLERLKSLGVNVVKASMVWWLVAPDASSTTAPSFDATNPAAYGTAAWARYDQLVETADKLGMQVYFQLVPPDPAWARDRTLPRQGKALGEAPIMKDFQQFVQAVGTRYDGHYRDASGNIIPRVAWWGVWNEPEYPTWLSPWSRKVHGKKQFIQAMLYRELVNAAWNGLSKTGHAHDTFLVGETGNVGVIDLMPFIEDLYCVNSSYKPLKGHAATAVGCPASGNRSSFVAENSGLFKMTGYAHHPYQFNNAPNHAPPASSWVTMENLGWLESVLKGIFSGYGHGRHGGIPLYLTEWGYMTNPPNPTVNCTPDDQAKWINQGEYMAWRLPYVKAIAQYKLWDGPPGVSWRTQWDSGLLFRDLKPKPAYRAFRLPIWVPDAKHGHAVTVWGQLRPSVYGGPRTGQLQFRRHGSSSWKKLATVKGQNSEAFFQVRVNIPSAGAIRLAWGGSHSRVVSIS